MYWFYWPIFSLFPRALHLKMNIIIKKQKLENPGIDPGASRMQIERSTTWANPPCALILFTNLFIISSWVAISNEYNYKERKLENPGIDPGASRMQSSAVPLELIPLMYWFYWPIFYLFPRSLQFAMTIIIKKQKWENIDPGPSRMLIERSTTWANPPCEMILFTNLFLISSWVAISNEYNYKETGIGEFGYRSRWL